MKILKRIIYVSAFLPLLAFGQSKDAGKPNWFNLDLNKDGVFGISTERAYCELLKGKKGSPVVVAVIDGGVDPQHEDLKPVMWSNSGEIAGNGIDDDKNGYIDDIFGWNFLGSEKGNVRYDNLEIVRLVRKYQDKYASVLNSTPLSVSEKSEFSLYKKLVTEHMNRLQNARFGYENYSLLKKNLETIVARIGKQNPGLKDFEQYDAQNDAESKVVKIVKSELKRDSDFNKVQEEIIEAYDYYHSQINYHLNIEFDPRDSIGDSYPNASERFYGNSDAKGPEADHGTHVAGIIGAVRSNGIGVKGVADNVRIMSIRAVPNGDERDKDVANAIRYAVDNGAKVVNMSFGKGFSWNKAVVDSAVKYAESKDVLLVHAAGNDSKNTDRVNNFPNRMYGDTTNANFWNLNDRLEAGQAMQSRPTQGMYGGIGRAPQFKPVIDSTKFSYTQAKNWIEVGASSWENDEDLVATFSNYGRRTVDVFAPGVRINSTMPESKYKEQDGTSMASPVVAGLAALIRSYYPSLTAVQVKDIIMKSVTKVNQKVRIVENGEKKKVPFSDLCISGGVVNAYKALELAAQMK